ncbi:MAG: hypothetical protein A2142_01440 [candidate division Zixibacteria bacterium RBG_16_48_11]|nr:MAG: hypothetical protein A2142_01440 [candidate division Zixibacteria bacterium RBG_16_48_11]
MRIIPDVSALSFRVLLRHKDVFLMQAKTSIIPPFLDPLFYLVGMGYGLGALVTNIEGMSYVQFIAPAIIASVMMTAPFFENTIGSFIRLKHQKTYDAMVSTPASVEDVVTGDILYGAFKALIQGTSVFIVVALFGLVTSWWGLLILPFCLMAGFMFACIAITYTAWMPDINYVDYFFVILLTPMFIFAGTFFPVSQLPGWAQEVAFFMPLYHVVNITRGLIVGNLSTSMLLDLLWMMMVTLIFYRLSLYMMKRRVLK